MFYPELSLARLKLKPFEHLSSFQYKSRKVFAGLQIPGTGHRFLHSFFLYRTIWAAKVLGEIKVLVQLNFPDDILNIPDDNGKAYPKREQYSMKLRPNAKILC